ncbi:MAG: sigma-54-dependent transcriptional regulator, partial [Nitrospiraceae bacterium]
MDDEPYLRQSLAELFVAEGYHVIEAADGEDALERLKQIAEYPHVIFLDLKMPRRDGMATMEALKARAGTRRIPIVVITSFGGSEQTIRAMKAGAYDYITKPFDANEVIRMAARAVQVSRLNHEVERLRSREDWDSLDGELVGRHPRMQEVFKYIGKVATSDSTVLITGESGTGKEGAAQAIHRHSARAARPMVTINCAAIPDGLLESELFGHERGAFTDAVLAKPGRLEMAEGGTVFLDEIGDLSVALQTKLLRVLQ